MSKMRDVVSSQGSSVRVLSILVALAIAALVVMVVRSPAMEWDVVAENLFAPTVLRGLGMTLVLTVIAVVLGSIIGTVLALLMMSPDRIARSIVSGYIWFFRGVPLLVQIFIWFNIATLFPRFSIGIPFTEIVFVDASMNQLVTPFIAAILAFSLHEGAFMAEIIRAGFESVAKGEIEAAQSLGYTKWQVFSRITLPQAMGMIIPPTGNQIITTLKQTAIVSVIAVQDLLYSVQIIYSRTFEVIPLLLVAAIWYLVFVTALTFVQRYVERYFNRWRYSKQPKSKDIPSTQTEKIALELT